MKSYTIKEVGELFQMPASTLRYYEDTGLLPDVKRTAEGQRIYEERHINRRESICCFKGAGMTISRMWELFQYMEEEGDHVDEILRLLYEQRDQTLASIQQMQKNLAHMERKIRHYKEMKDALSESR